MEDKSMGGTADTAPSPAYSKMGHFAKTSAQVITDYLVWYNNYIVQYNIYESVKHENF